ncbi:PREDICTED: solute carrier family 15 member 4-like [Amphimedon queenslandica]|nr:PREDICTED: solute carrier family 15 member 4-like [Amphimedon queenslandica]|eukprot:XP_011404484.1 PREDICTED: solute carrier family 15 member 4-like [Amphimedon queenslandica]
MPSILLLIFALSIAVCHSIFDSIFKHLSGTQNDKYDPSSYSKKISDIGIVIGIVIGNAFYLFVPFCGWLSDTKIGRSNAIYLSLWLGWIGTLLWAIGCCFQYYSCDTAPIARYAFFITAFVFMFASMAFMFTNIIAYGIDQLMNESSIKIRAFIHWSWLFLYSGNALSVISNKLITAVVAFFLFSISLCLHFFLKDHFEHIPIPDSYRIVFKVLKFFIQNNRRQQRSAFTYWGEEPSRMDLAKERYGGSFTHEEVENVKTFLRIIAVLVTVFPICISNTPYLFNSSNFVAQFKNGTDDLHGHVQDSIWLLGNFSPLIILVPLFELVVLPLFPKLEYFLTNPLKGIGIANILFIISILSTFFIDLVGRSFKNSDMPCFFTWKPESVHETIQISYWILLIPSVVAGTSLALLWICVLEFICSQTPFGMHGMIIGLFWFLHGVYADIGMAITYYAIPPISFMSCTSWFSFIFGVIAVFGLVVYVLVARWYVKRIRDTDLGLRAAVEEQWEKRLIQKNTFKENETDDEDFSI